jgi:Flp pilus assembly protein TadD
VWSHIILGRALLAQGHANEALESLERAYTMEPTLPEAVAGRAQGQAAVGRETDARATFVELSNLGSRRHVSPFDVATIHAALGEEEEALRQLDAAYEQRAYLLASIGGLAFFDGLRDRAAFLELLSKLELPELVAGRAPSGS